MRASSRIWKKSLVARLVCYFMLLSLVTVAVSGSIAFWQARQALRVSVLDRLSVAARLKEDALSRWADDQIQDFLLFARMPSIQTRGTVLISEERSEIDRQAAYGELSRVFEAALEHNSGWLEILVLSAKSEIVLSTDASHEGDFRIVDRYFTEGRRRQFVQSVYPSPLTSRPTISIATPIGDPATSQAGVIALHLDLRRMDEILLERAGLGASSESYLVDGFNVLISGQRFGRDEYPRGVRSEGIDAALEGTDGAKLYRSYAGVPVIGVYRWIDDLEIALLTEVSQQEAFAPARRLARLILTVGLLVAAGLTLGIYLLARQIARPVLSLTRAALEVAGGDLSAQAPILTDDEVGVLGRTFNQMTARLRALYDDLAQEINERKRAQEEREGLITELEAKNAELERFAYTVSHDLKSPLVTIRGFLGFLEKDAAGGNLDRMADDIARIRSASDTMVRLLEDLLELSRIGRLVNSPEEIAFGPLVREASDLLAGGLAERGVELFVDADLPSLFGDRVRLLEVFQNLIENAIKAMDHQPRPRIEIGARRDGAEIVCYVRDNGKGIDPQYHQKIFGLFNQLNQNDEGTGIGLTLVRRIVETHKGRIWIESEPGRGATFFFTLPARAAAGEL